MGGNRFQSCTVAYRETDLWIGIDPPTNLDKLKTYIYRKIVTLRVLLDEYIIQNPEFYRSLTPIARNQKMPALIRPMMVAARKAGTGPMSSVAGLFSQHIGESIRKDFTPRELVIENGGDIFLSLCDDLQMSIYAGKSPLSNRIGIKIPADRTPLGVCTSSATVGPSLSFGTADAITIVCRDAPLADAYATAFGNSVHSPKDIKTVLETIAKIPAILSAVIICGENLGVGGEFEMITF